MLIRTRQNADPFGRLTSEMDRLFESMFSGTSRVPHADVPSRWVSAPLNLWEDEQNIYVETEVPGVKMDDLEILVIDNGLIVRGERKIDLPEDVRVLRRERGSGNFERRTSLPVEVEVENVCADLRDGVLTVTLPKVAARQPRRITVNPQATD